MRRAGSFSSLCVVTALALLASPASAAIYENVVDADNEDDLMAMEQRGDISSATLETLLDLMNEGVDLNTGEREQLYDLPGLTYADVDAILKYRAEVGRISDPAQLVSAGVLTAAQVVQVMPFLRLEVAAIRLPISGRVNAVSRFTTTDTVAPPVLFNARLKGPFDLTGGVLLATTRRQVASPTWDASTDTLVTSGFGYQVNAPRFFLQWANARARVVVGTFDLGFAERLVLDTSRRTTPNGLYLTESFVRPLDLARTCKLSGGSDVAAGGCSAGEANLYVTPDFTVREAFRGVAASVEDLSLGPASSLSLYGFASYQARSIYQYELYDRRVCEDPRDPDCSAPPVYLPDGSTRLVYSTLPYLFDELTSGGHVTLKPAPGLSLGVTGYGALPVFHAAPAELDFQEWSRRPNGGAFGAVGLNGSAVWNDLSFFLEAARSFDGASGNEGGGWGLTQRTTWSPKRHELELSLRYYDLHFANPYSRAIASPDELDGQRARNELGARLRYAGRLSKDLQVRARVDGWLNPFAVTDRQPAGVANVYALARVEFTRWQVFQPAVWVDVRNRNLASNTRGTCASGTAALVEGEPYVCSGDLYRVGARLEVVPHRRLLRVIAQGTFTWADDVRYDERFRNDAMFWGELRSQPADWLQLRLKTRWLYRDVSDNTYLEQNLSTFFEAAWLPTQGTSLGVRYDVVVWLDQRDSTVTRAPNPEHRFTLDLRTAF
jgi:hypothetical protein